MEYERIQKPSSRLASGFSVSPKKLRLILLGLEKTQSGEESEEPTYIAEQDMTESDQTRQNTVDQFNIECSTSLSNSNSTGSGPHRAKVKVHDEDSFDSDSVSSSFNFQKPGPFVHVQKFKFNNPSALLPPFSKPTPSKWDDAQKWISSPNSNKTGRGRKNGKSGLVVNKVVMNKEGDSNLNLNFKKVDSSIARKIGDIEKGSFGKSASWVDEPFGFVELAGIGVDKPLVDSPASTNAPTNEPVQEVRAVSMRDMGTEMTPIASQEPSRTATPVQSTTPIRSRASSRTSTPPRNRASSITNEFSENNMQTKTRKEIMELGEQLGKHNITAWAKSRGQDGNNTTVKNRAEDDIKIRAADWEEAEKSKYLAWFQREEIKIQVWENHQKAKIDAEMQKIEVDIEKIRARAQEKLMNKLAASRYKADQKRAKAEAKKKKDAETTEKQSDFIRRTGRVPRRYSSFWSSCF